MRLAAIRLNYFMAYAAIGAFGPYIALHLKDVGLTDAQLGWVLGIYGVPILFGPPLVTHLADRFGANRLLMGVCYLLTSLILLLLYHQTTFWPILLTYGLMSLVQTSIVPLLDGLIFSLLDGSATSVKTHGAARRKDQYLSIRIWGSIGFMSPSGLMWYWIHHLDGTPSDSLAMGVVISLLGMAGVWLLPAKRKLNHLPSALALTTVAAWKTLHLREVRVFLGTMVLASLASYMLYNYYTPYLRILGVKEAWMGPISSLGVLSEIICMFAWVWILHRFGFRNMMIIGMGVIVARLCIVAFTPWATLAVAAQVLHGPLVICMYVAPPMYLNYKAHSNYRNSMQGLYAFLCYGVARLAGSVSAGYTAQAGQKVYLENFGTLADQATLYGYRCTFAFGALLALAGMFLIAWSFHDPKACKALAEGRYAEQEIPDPDGHV